MKSIDINIEKLNDSELRWALVSLISKAKRDQLVRFFETLKKTEHKTESSELGNLPFVLTPEQEAELMVSLEESYHEENLMTLEEAKKMHAKWLKT
jgi:hypothetical protein